VTRISSLALTIAWTGILLGLAVISAASVVFASDVKLQLAFQERPVHKGALAQQRSPTNDQIVAMPSSGGAEPRRAVRVVYVGPITAR
jgi:hypothetical protein